MRMDKKTIKEMLEREPFDPFTIVMSSGERYDIRNPGLVVPMPNRVFIAMPAENQQPSDQYILCSYLHITAVKTLQAA